MTDKTRSNECSTGSHPFIHESVWIGTPWDSSKPPPPPEKSNAELIFELHERLRTNQNVADVFSTSAKNATTGRRFDPPPPTKKLGKAAAPMLSIQQLATQYTLNPFTEELKASRLPFEVGPKISRIAVL